MPAPAIPHAPADITPEWLTDVFREAGLDVTVDGLSRVAIGEGAGMMSTVTQVIPHYRTGQGPASVVIKLPTPNTRNRQVAIDFDNYRREIRFYLDAAHRTRMRTPAVYLAACPSPADFVLVLEDLTAWTIGDQVKGCDATQTRQCLEALAELHGAFWNRVDDGSRNWMPDCAESVMSAGLSQGTAAVYDRFVELFSASLPESLKTLGPRYNAALPNLQRWMNDAPRTLVHGDFRMDNLFFRGAGSRDEPVACCDWQGSVRGKGIHDVAYLLSGSVPVELRRAQENALVEHWRSSLPDAVREAYDPDQAWQDYRRAVLYLWTYPVVIGGALDPANARARSWVGAMVARSATAMIDLQCVDLLTEFE
jgi:aminoglycoside/choline kinase family phosphotransferase